MLKFILGVPLCIIGSWGTNMSQIILKMFHNDHVQREMEKREQLDPIFNKFNIGCNTFLHPIIINIV